MRRISMYTPKKNKPKYERIEYACPGCGVIATQSWTKLVNDLWLQQIKGTFCPNCEASRNR